ncbi:4Fe-4S binding protein [Hominifimenecus microfluidus]|uniref:4Fe-4S binding protein n=1 Tax=Hominifimenecus microfluidus TaxID=2885348 RepID=UPI0032C0CF60
MAENKKEQKKPLTAAEKRRKAQKQKAWLRAGIQFIFFLSMPGAFVAGFSGIKHLFQWIGAGEPLQVDSFVLALIGLCAFTILFGRFFCGYVCAFGGLGDGVFWLSGVVQKKLLHRKKQYQLPEKLVRPFQMIKYVILFAIVLLCTLGLYGNLSGTSPWDVFSRLTALKLPAAGYGIGIVLMILIVAGMAIQPRFFCQFLCPMGAVFSLLPILPFAQLKRNSEQCISGCSACEKRCPVNLKLEEASLRNGECIACEVCTDICPRSNISRWDLALTKNFWLAALVKAILFFMMGICLGFCRFL